MEASYVIWPKVLCNGENIFRVSILKYAYFSQIYFQSYVKMSAPHYGL